MEKKFSTGFRRYLLLLGDLGVLYAALWCTLLIRYREEFTATLWQQHVWPFTAVFFVLVVVFYIDELYTLGYGQGQLQLITRVTRSVAITALISSALFYFGADRLFTIKPQRVLVLNLAIGALFVYLWHAAVLLVAKSRQLAHGILLIGSNQLTNELLKKISEHPELGYEVRAYVASTPNEPVPALPTGIARFTGISLLESACLEQRVELIVSTVHPRENPELLKQLFKCLHHKIGFLDIATFYERITGKIPVSTIERVWLLENLSVSTHRGYELAKRLVDVLVALVLGIVTLVLAPLIAVAIKLSSSGPVLFRQDRVGKDGRRFQIVKFRTMVAQAEPNGPQWAEKDDKRVTRVGRLLRRTRIDELPQLLNVLRGEMSLIGPRPERPEFVERLQQQIPFYEERLLVAPGLTGWAQVVGPAYGGSVEESREKIQYDLYYIKNRSIALDLAIILRTIRTVLSRQGV